MKTVYWAVILAILVAAAGMYWYTASTTPGPYNAFAQCLTDKGTVMYGTDWCHVCQTQKSLFGDSFRYVSYKNCDYERALCLERGVDRYPTWIIGGETYVGKQGLETLSSLTGCALS